MRWTWHGGDDKYIHLKKTENKKTLGRHWGVWDYNIKTDVK
jgi:hypothetical protein